MLLFPQSVLVRPILRAWFLLSLILALLPSGARSQDVLTYHNNNFRTGANPSETTLTLANVNVATFGKLFSIPVDDLVDAQPLYLSNLSIAGSTHNVLIIVTEHGTVYAFDADTGAKIWRVSTLQANETTDDDRGCNLAAPPAGIIATPVISRPKTGNPVIYLVSMSLDASQNYHQRLHALDATTGQEVHNAPVEIQAKYTGTGDNSDGINVIFDPAHYKERAALLMVKGTIYLAFGSHCDFRPYTGWIMAYDANTLAQTSVLNLTPNSNEGGIWMSGGGMAADPATGDIFVPDGNGVFDSILNPAGFPEEGDYGNAFLHISTAGGLAVADYFEMKNQAGENGQDIDLGSGGVVLVNAKDSTGKTWNLGVAAGKDSAIYIVDRTNMGKFSLRANLNYQTIQGALHGGIWSTPAFYNGRIYWGPVGSPILGFQFQNAKLMPTPFARTPNSFLYPGASPSISSNAGQNTILWATEYLNPGVLHAYDARTLNELYNSNQAPNNRDHYGSGNKFVTPTIANGKVYVGGNQTVGVFGLLNRK